MSNKFKTVLVQLEQMFYTFTYNWCNSMSTNTYESQSNAKHHQKQQPKLFLLILKFSKLIRKVSCSLNQSRPRKLCNFLITMTTKVESNCI